ncbi:hypothetical protein AB0L57_08570 [Nocardia sp. NPDC052254]|uniref:hypothetical protein n=1 Tax=Nocardia sp. NPDC052254 TaxID=3155681 RepID=UPI0034155C8A
MTAAIWFGLAAIALVGAIVLLYFDRVQRQRTGHVRQVWAKSQGYTYVSVEPSLASTWRRGAMAKLGYLSAIDVVSGNRKGEKFVLFDLEDAATLVAVRRQIGSDIDIDLRLKTAAPPKDADLELLGAIGDRVVFATNPDVARHAVDQRMVHFIETLPDSVQQLWSEGNWTLGMLPVGTVSKDWEAAIDSVLRLSGLLHVLPPVAGGDRRMEADLHDPGRPRPDFDDRYDEPVVPAADRRFDDYDERPADRYEDDEFDQRGPGRFDDDHRQERDDRGPERADRGPERADFRPERAEFRPEREDRGAGHEAFGPGHPDYPRLDDGPRGDTRQAPIPEPGRGRIDDAGDSSPGSPVDQGRADGRDLGERAVHDPADRASGVIAAPPAGESEQAAPRRPALAVVPDPRNRVRRNWPPAPEYTEDPEDEESGSVAADLEESQAEDEQTKRPGGPFHPGFRPYQGPAPR